MVKYLVDMHTVVKNQTDGKRRKILSIVNLMVQFYDMRKLDNSVEIITDMLVNQIATHKTSLFFRNHNLLFLSLRTLTLIYQKRLALVASPTKENLDQLV